MKMKQCLYCNYATNNKSNYNKHMKRMHSVALVRDNIVLKDIGYKENVNKNFYGEESVDIRLKENFKLFVSGPSRCGKTVLYLTFWNELLTLQRYHQLKLFM